MPQKKKKQQLHVTFWIAKHKVCAFCEVEMWKKLKCEKKKKKCEKKKKKRKKVKKKLKLKKLSMLKNEMKEKCVHFEYVYGGGDRAQLNINKNCDLRMSRVKVTPWNAKKKPSHNVCVNENKCEFDKNDDHLKLPECCSACIIINLLLKHNKMLLIRVLNCVTIFIYSGSLVAVFFHKIIVMASSWMAHQMANPSHLLFVSVFVSGEGRQFLYICVCAGFRDKIQFHDHSIIHLLNFCFLWYFTAIPFALQSRKKANNFYSLAFILHIFILCMEFLLSLISNTKRKYHSHSHTHLMHSNTV